MVPLGSIVGDGAAGVGVVAGMIAIGGFLTHAAPVLQRRDEASIRIATVIGGIGGFAMGGLVVIAQVVLG